MVRPASFGPQPEDQAVSDQTSLIQHLFERTLKEGRRKKNREYKDGGRVREGSYARGSREFLTVAVLELNGFTVHAEQIDWESFNLSADSTGSRYVIKVLDGDTVVFEAKCTGPGETKKFGYQERYEGTDYTSQGDWVVLSGELPENLEVVAN